MNSNIGKFGPNKPILTKEFINYKPLLPNREGTYETRELEELIRTIEDNEREEKEKNGEKGSLRMPIVNSLRLEKLTESEKLRIPIEEEMKTTIGLTPPDMKECLSPIPTPDLHSPRSPNQGLQTSYFRERVASGGFGDHAMFKCAHEMYTDHSLQQSFITLNEHISLASMPSQLPTVDLDISLLQTIRTQKRPDGKYYRLLILDLDNTLIQSLTTKQYFDYYENNETKLEVIKAENNINFLLRPFLFDFLRCMKQYYKIVVFTAAGRRYAEIILNKIQEIAKENFFEYAYSMSNLLLINDNICAKRLINNIKHKKQVAVDDRFSPWFHCPNNYVPILPFRGQSTDIALLTLASYLKELANANNVCKFNKKYIRINEKMLQFQKLYPFLSNRNKNGKYISQNVQSPSS